MRSSAPESTDIVSPKHAVGGQYDHAFEPSLGNENTVERIRVMHRQIEYRQRMPLQDGKGTDTLLKILLCVSF